MTSARQLAANRRNAERSTGPRTQNGKARSRMNALRHGLAAVDSKGSHWEKQISHSINEVCDRLQRIDAISRELLIQLDHATAIGSTEQALKVLRRLGATVRYATRAHGKLKAVR